MRSFTVVVLLLLGVMMAAPASSQVADGEVGTEAAEPDTAALAELTPKELFLRAS